MKFTLSLFALVIVLAACQPAPTPEAPLPTLAILPSETLTEPPIEVEATLPTAEVTAGLTETVTPAVIPSETLTPTLTATRTPRPATATLTVEPTQAAISTATQAILEAPRYSTFTPAPDNTNGGTTNVVADVSINEAQFQEEVDRNLSAYPSIDRAIVDFIDGAINVNMTITNPTLGTLSGTVTIPVILNGDLAEITISAIQSAQGNPPQAYIDVATSDLFVMMVSTLDQIVQQRVGPQQKLKSIIVTNTDIGVTLVVPKTE